MAKIPRTRFLHLLCASIASCISMSDLHDLEKWSEEVHGGGRENDGFAVYRTVVT